MTIAIIDDGPLDHLACVVDLAALASWPGDRFVIADATARGASGRRKAMLEMPSSPFKQFEVVVGTEASTRSSSASCASEPERASRGRSR
jgi:hypothetical protein